MNEVIELYDDEILQEIKDKRTQKNLSMGDIIVMQCVICVLIIVILIALNFIKPDLTQDIITEIKSEIQKPMGTNDDLLGLYKDFLKIFNG